MANKIKKSGTMGTGGKNRIVRPSDIPSTPMPNSRVPAPGANSVVRISK